MIFDAKEARRLYLEENSTFRTALDNIRRSAMSGSRNASINLDDYNMDKQLIVDELKDRGFKVEAGNGTTYVNW